MYIFSHISLSLTRYHVTKLANYRKFNMLIPVDYLKNIKILIIDDDEEDFLIIKKYISRIKSNNGIELEWCENYGEGVEAIFKGKHDLYFVDFLLGPETGLDLIRKVSGRSYAQPIILLTGAGNQDVDMKAMDSGAADYLIKSELTTEKLERCIRYSLTRYEFLTVLKESEQKYRNIFEKTKDFIFIADETFAFREVNQIGTLLFGYSFAEFESLKLTNLLVYESDSVFIKETLERVGELNDMEVELQTKSLQAVNCILSLSAEKNGLNGYYIQGIIHDITSLKNAEKANLQTTLLKATERLMRTIAHEVRNPLNNIILAVEQLHLLDETDRPYVEILERNSNRINNLITELLRSSSPTVIELTEISLEAVLETSIESALDRLILKKVKLKRDYQASAPVIMADPNKLSTAFLNVIINGIEACPANNAEITISLVEAAGHYTVSITDNGHGIEEEHMDRLFEPYFTSKAAGMGLGLASALNTFESHKAFVKLKSVVGNGTSFYIIFNK